MRACKCVCFCCFAWSCFGFGARSKVYCPALHCAALRCTALHCTALSFFPPEQAVLEAFERALPADFGFQIFHSWHNRAHVHDAVQSLHRKVILSELDYGHTDLSITEYTQLLMSAEFWWSVAGQTILIFQLDSVLCSRAYLNLTDFLSFDFVGAPWIHRHACQASNAKVAVGNGGLSIRSRAKMLQLYEHAVPAQLQPDEDVHIGCACADKSLQMVCADVEHAAAFSVESIFHPAPVGVHKPWVHLDSHQLRTLATNCPELALIMPDSEAPARIQRYV